MTAAGCALSHSPLMGFNDPGKEIQSRVDDALANARKFVRAFDPELVVMFGPDHYNGFFYNLMPPFCVGAHATAVGDYGTPEGDLSVDGDAAHEIAKNVLADGVDIAISEQMYVDHGFSQPLQILFGGLTDVPLVPIFINSVAPPLGPISRTRALGAAIGRFLTHSDRRVLFLGSGGLSHDPPVPRIDQATEEVLARLIDGRNPSEQERARRQQRVIEAGNALAAGTSTMLPLNPTWDMAFLDTLEEGHLSRVDSWSNGWLEGQAGKSVHEVRTWIAAYAALAATGPYHLDYRFYEPIDKWIAGFAVTTATVQGSHLLAC